MKCNEYTLQLDEKSLCNAYSKQTLGRIISVDDDSVLLTPFIENGEVDKARKLSHVDPAHFANVTSHSGFITVNKTAKSHLFFWFFPAELKPLNSAPWIIWLQGGPGAASLFGLFAEIGPIHIVNGSTEKRPITWGTNYSLLFIDNPVGSGFSFTNNNEYVTNIDQVGAGLLNFLQQFLQLFPELRKTPLFIAGESYAGKYIPAFGHYIHHNKNDSLPINLKGLAIGDGWTDPITLLHYSEFALQVGLLDPEQAAMVHSLEEQANEYYKKGNMQEYSKSAKEAYALFKSMSEVSNYNYLTDDDANVDYIKFLNIPAVRKALHVGNLEYDNINEDVYRHLAGDMYMSVKPWLEELLEHYGVMCYSGQLDVIVAYALSVNTYRNLEWSGAANYRNATRQKLYSYEGGKKHVTSYIKSYGNFMDVMVRGAGHMVPTDQPAAAKQIIDMFISKFK